MNDNRKIIGYDTQTGKPIYENKKIVRYDTQTGEPIYETISSNLSNRKLDNANNLVHQNQYVVNNSYNSNIKPRKKFKIIWIILPIIVILTILSVILIFILVGGKNKNYSRTVMIYMVGSNLESDHGLATVDLDELDYDEIDNKNVNVVLIAGGSEKWNNNYIDVDETSIYELTSSGFEKIKMNNIQNMGSPDVLSDFLNYVYKNYKTDKYDLIFWDHGGAIIGSEFDDISNDNLSLADFEQALQNSPFNQTNKLEIVMFRTCLNGTIEIANIFSNYADYLVASEEVTMGVSTDGVLEFINDIEPSDSGYDISLKFINKYKDMIHSLNELYYGLDVEDYVYSTYSIVDLSKIEALSLSINDFFDDINVSQNYNQIAKVRSNLYQYSSDTADFDMVDLYNLVDSLKSLSPDKADKVLNNLNQAVLYNWASTPDSRGISIYFPYNGSRNAKSTLLSMYKNFDELTAYNSFINKFYNIQTSSKNSYTYSKNILNVDAKDSEADFELELTDEQKETFAKAGYMVFRDNGDGYFLPVYSSNDVELDGNTLKANIKDRQLKVVSKKDNSENILTSFELENTDDYIKYKTIVTLENISNWKFDSANMILIYDKKSGETKIGNITLVEEENNKPNMVSVNMNDYSHIVFASSSYKILDENGNYVEDWDSNGVIKGIEEEVGKFDFQLQSYDENIDYYCIFKIRDTNNNLYYSKLVKMK